jgi:hypothetical protein
MIPRFGRQDRRFRTFAWIGFSRRLVRDVTVSRSGDRRDCGNQLAIPTWLMIATSFGATKPAIAFCCSFVGAQWYLARFPATQVARACHTLATSSF